MDKNIRASCSCKGNIQDKRSADTIANGCRNLNKRFREVEFAINEVVLYLDAYPDCGEALEYYHRLIEEREMLIKSINIQCGPMTYFGNVSKDTWSWINGPWPWKYEAN